MELRVQGHRVLSQAIKPIGLDAEVWKTRFRKACSLSLEEQFDQKLVRSLSEGVFLLVSTAQECDSFVQLVFLCWFSSGFF